MSEPVSFANPNPRSPFRPPSQPTHLRIHSTDSSDGSSSSPPTLDFFNLTERRGSLRSLHHDPNRNSGGSWNGDLPPSRRGSAVGHALNSKRSGELGWSPNKPSSPAASRRPSLTPSLSFNYAPIVPLTGHTRGRRPSSSSSAVTVRAGSPSQAGLLPFGHNFKASHAASVRRSSFTPSLHATSLNSPTATVVSMPPPPAHSSTDAFAAGSPFFTPSPSRELRSFRFGASPPAPTSPAGRAVRRPSYEPPDSEDADAEEDEDDEEVDQARERFREHLAKAGLASIPISLPASPKASARAKPVLGPMSKYAPFGSLTSPVDSSASSSHSGSNRTAATRPPAFERRPSARRYDGPLARRPTHTPTAGSSSSSDEERTPGQHTITRQSTNRQSIDARRLGLEYRKIIRPDDDGSGIEAESDSEESGPGSKHSSPVLPHDPTFHTSTSAGKGRSLAAWDTYSFADRTMPSPQQTELIRHLAPAVSLDEKPVRRSISPHQPPPPTIQEPPQPFPHIDTGLLGLGGLKRGSISGHSPPRSLSDSAVPRRPSLAEEIQVVIPPPHLNASGAMSVSGGDDVEWDLDFVLGGAEPVQSDFVNSDYQLAIGMRTARPGAQFDPSSLGLGPGFDQFGAPDMQNDSFAQFVREKDPVFEEMRVAWTLVRPQPPHNEWALPTTGGYTYIPSLAAFNSPSRSSIASSIDASAGSTTSAGLGGPPHVQFQSPDPVIQSNRPPARAWALKSRGRGWGIVPMQGAREEIKFGPKGKWRMDDAGVRSNRSSMSSKGRMRRSSSKDTEARSRGGSGVSSESGMSIFATDEEPKVGSLSPDPQSGQRSIPIPIASSSSGALRPPKKEKKKKSGWLSAIKSASSALSPNSGGSDRGKSYSVSASSSGTDDSRVMPVGSLEKQHGNYIPPWLTVAGTERQKESSLAAKFNKLKSRNLSDRKDRAMSSGGEGDLSTSLKSRNNLFETDEEDDGEAREGKAWEDVPTEALAMVIPLAVPQSPASIQSATFSDPESSPDVSTGQWTSRHSVSIDPLASLDEVKQHRHRRDRRKSTLPPPKPENSLLVYFVPFGCDVYERGGVCTDHSHGHLTSTTPTGPAKLFAHMRIKKTQSQLFNRNSPTPPPTGSSGPRPPSGYLASNLSHSSTGSSSANLIVKPPSPSNAPSPIGLVDGPTSFSSFRIVARVVDPSDLTFIPSWPSWESQGPAAHASSQAQVMLSEPGTNPETKAKDSRNGRTDPTVVGVSHGNTVEFIQEGWERLGMEDELDEVLGCLVAACIALLSSGSSGHESCM